MKVFRFVSKTCSSLYIDVKAKDVVSAESELNRIIEEIEESYNMQVHLPSASRFEMWAAVPCVEPQKLRR